MKKNIIFSIISIATMLMILPVFGQDENKLTRKEKKDGWVQLFNGQNFSGWRQNNGTEMPKNWMIEENAMKVYTGEGKKPGRAFSGRNPKRQN